tara:strand:+ start:249 stop:494 length:246 start_codon:yes stop_codon:yes gene_type:complete
MARSSKHTGAKFANGNYKSYQKKLDATPEQRKKRAALNAENRRRGTYGNGDGKDVSHKRDGSTVLESMKINRARVGKKRKA